MSACVYDAVKTVCGTHCVYTVRREKDGILRAGFRNTEIDSAADADLLFFL